MQSLFSILAVISLLDSISITPICIFPLAAILGGSQPFLGATSLLLGIFITYTVSGLLLLVGFDFLCDDLAQAFSRWWNQPNTPELLLQIVIGGVMLGFSWRLAKARQIQRPSAIQRNFSPVGGFSLGMGLTLVSMPGALPYFGALDQILRADLGYVTSGIALLFYNIIFIVPLGALLLVRLVVPAKSAAIFCRVASLTSRWGRHLTVAILICIGTVFIADGVGWFLGHPLLPVAYSTQILQ